MAACPDCDAHITLPASAYVGQPLVCPECGCALEVSSLEPPTVDYAAGAPDAPDAEDW